MWSAILSWRAHSEYVDNHYVLYIISIAPWLTTLECVILFFISSAAVGRKHSWPMCTVWLQHRHIQCISNTCGSRWPPNETYMHAPYHSNCKWFYSFYNHYLQVVSDYYNVPDIRSGAPADYHCTGAVILCTWVMSVSYPQQLRI